MLKNKELRLRVAEARRRDVGYGIARIDREVGASIGLSTGDIIEIQGKKIAAATLWLGYSDEKEKDIIRIDGYIRSNAGVSLNEYVIVRKADVKEAFSITLAPVNTSIKTDENLTRIIKSRLIDYPVIQKNIIPVLFFGNLFTFAVLQTKPSGVVKITPKTNIIIQSRVLQEKALKASVTYEDIGGLKDEIQRIREMIELPLKFPEIFQKLGVEPPKGVLLYGPPGCGKTLLAKAVANESEANFILVNGPEIFSKWVGESEKAVREIFRKARMAAPSIVFFDEIEAIATRKELLGDDSGVSYRVISQLVTEIDGVKKLSDVIVIGATNRPDLIDPAMLRPGRLDWLVYVPPPDEKARLQILKIYTNKMPLSPDVSLEYLAKITDGYTGADLENICREAALQAMRRDINSDVVTFNDFENALKTIKPSISSSMIKEYERIKERIRVSERPSPIVG
ncbi:MAG: AAA family ATPase [Nitrososphaerota archaeon]